MQSCCSQCYVIQPVHNILHECVVGCPILSSMYDHVPIYLQLHVSSWTVHLHTFLLSLRFNFSPSRLLQLWIEAACETSLARDKHAMQSTLKFRRGRYSFIECRPMNVFDTFSTHCNSVHSQSSVPNGIRNQIHLRSQMMCDVLK